MIDSHGKEIHDANVMESSIFTYVNEKPSLESSKVTLSNDSINDRSLSPPSSEQTESYPLLRGFPYESDVQCNIILQRSNSTGNPITFNTHIVDDHQEGDKFYYVVSLSDAPESDLTVTLSVQRHHGHQREILFDKTELVFSASNWSTSQKVTLQSLQDGIVQSTSVNTLFTLTASTTGNCNEDNNQFKIKNSDSSRVRFYGNHRRIFREGEYFEIKVWLPYKPIGIVHITPGCSRNCHNFVFTPSRMEFTPDNFNQPKTFKVSAVYDGVTRPPYGQTYNVDTEGDGYDSRYQMALRFNDDGRLNISETSLTIAEGDSSTFTVTLLDRPVETVRVAVPAFQNTVSFSHDRLDSLTFDVQNWDQPQTVIVKALEDDNATSETETLQLRASGGRYDGITGNVKVTSIDNDLAGAEVIITPNPVQINEGSEVDLSLRLKVMPTDEVTVTIPSPNNAQLFFTPSSITFPSASFDTPQSVTLTATKDNDDVPVEPETVTVTASGGGYDDVTTSLTIQLTEIYEPSLKFEPVVRVPEGEMNEEDFVVFLGTRPSDTVDVVITGHEDSDLILDKTTLQFTPNETATSSDWNDPKIVILSAKHDDDAIEDVITVNLLASGAEYDGFTGSIKVIIDEDDSRPQVSLSASPNPVDEGQDVIVKATISSVLSDQVTIPLVVTPGTASASDDYQLLSQPAQIVMDAGEVEGEMTIRAMDDDLLEGSEIFTVEFGTLPPLMDSGTPSPVEITITDTDRATVQVPTSVDVREGSSKTIMVSLGASPSGDVSITIQRQSQSELELSPTELPFTSTTWNTPQKVTITALQDEDFISETETLTLNATGGNHPWESASVSVKIIDQGRPTTRPTVELSVAPNPVTENQTTNLTVTLSAPLPNPVTINLSYEHITTEPSDFRPVERISIVANATSASHSLTILDDDVAETDETFRITLQKPDGIELGTPHSQTVTIKDDGDLPPPAEISLTADRNTIVEGESVQITAILSFPLTEDVTIPLAYPSDGATAELIVDYTPLEQLTITAGNRTQSEWIQTTMDNLVEANETFIVSLGALPSDVRNGRPLFQEITIIDRDEAIIEAPSLVELLEGQQKTIQVSLTAIPSNDVSIVMGGYDPSKLTVSPSALEFSPDQWDDPMEVTLTALQDDDLIPDQVTLKLTAAGSEYTGVTHEIQVFITDDDDAGLVVPSSVVIQEGDTESFGVRLAQIPTKTVTVTISGYSGTDLILQSSNVLTFSTSDWDQDQMVELFAQEDPDANEEDPVSLILSASGGGYSLSETVTVTIVEKDPKGILVEPSSLTITEGASGRLSASLLSEPFGDVLITLSGYESTDITVTPPSISFTPLDWARSQDVTLQSVKDANLTDEVVTLRLTASGGRYDGQQKEVLVTIEDEGLPKITIFNSEANEQDGVISLPLELSHSSDKVVTVQYSSAGQTADEGVDYTASRGIVIFDPGGTRGVVQLAILDDDQPEDDETFIVTLSNASNATIARPSATAKILDNDGGVPTIMIEDATASQDAHAVMFDLYLSHPSPDPVFLHYRTADGSAIGGEDYAQQSGQVTFPAGSVHATIEVPLLRKEFHGQEETFFVELESTTSAKMDKAIATATLSKQPTESDIAISAYTARFARTVSVQLTEALQERLQPTGSTCSAAQHVESTRLWDPASSWTPSLGELLSGCRVSTTASSGHIGVWGRGAFRRFHGGTDRDVTLRGDVSTAMIGTDYRWSTGWLAGVMVAHSQSSGTFKDSEDDGSIDADLTGIYPYMSYAASDWKVWMSAGYGWGDAEVSNLREDLTSRFGAVGLKGHLASVRTSRLSYFGDVLLTDVEMKSHGDRAEVVRVRLGVESTFQISRGWTPYVEANMRQDGGDAETGIGLELGGGLRINHPDWNLRGEIRSQGLVIHSADGFTEWGLSGSIQVGRSHDGWMIRVRPSYGRNHGPSLHQQWAVMDSTPSVPGMYRTEMEFGYGIPMRKGTARSFVGLTQRPSGHMVRLGGELRPTDWVSISVSGLAHHQASTLGGISLNVHSTLSY